MTLDEAIEYHERIDKIETQACFLISQEDGDYESHKRCAEEHRQLTEWLKDYKRLLEQQPTLDKIRTEVEQTASRYSISRERGCIGQVEWSDRLIKESEVMQILDKYKAESEE